MALRKLDAPQWKTYFDDFSKQVAHNQCPRYAEIRIRTQKRGIEAETTWIPPQGITYDQHNDALEIVVDNLDRMIFHPTTIYVYEEQNGCLCSIEIDQADGTREVVRIR